MSNGSWNLNIDLSFEFSHSSFHQAPWIPYIIPEFLPRIQRPLINQFAKIIRLKLGPWLFVQYRVAHLFWFFSFKVSADEFKRFTGHGHFIHHQNFKTLKTALNPLG